MKTPDLIVGAEVRAKERGITVNDICRALEINRATWQRWKAGTNEPPLSKWTALQSLLGNEIAA